MADMFTTTLNRMSKNIFFDSLLIVLICFGLWIGKSSIPVYAGTPIGAEYNSTTTSSSIANHAVLRPAPGVLGSVVITTVGTGTFVLYDATTTDATKRTKAATTTLASFGASTAAGTYAFDIIATQGILLDYTGVLATSTITSR